jgi:hypothetical protein
MIKAQPAGGSGPDAAMLVFADLADSSAGQALFGAILNPGALEKAVQAVLQQPQRLERPGGRSVPDRVEYAAVRMKLETLLRRLEEQRAILQGKQGADSRGVV